MKKTSVQFTRLLKMYPLAVVALSLGACAKSNHASPQAPAAAAQTQAQAQQPQSDCEKTRDYYYQKSGLQVEPVQKVQIVRKYQRVIRKNCDGSVESDKIETVVPPHVDLNLSPKGKLAQQALAVSVFNPDTCNFSGTTLPQKDYLLFGKLIALTGEKDGRIKIKGDLSPALLTFQLKTGLNQIFYTYYRDCLPEADIGTSHGSYVPTCKTSAEVQSGLYYVDVAYRSETLSGTKVVTATCKAQK
jgi:hypothetical protein